MKKIFIRGILYGLLLYVAFDTITGLALLAGANPVIYDEVIPCELSDYAKDIISEGEYKEVHCGRYR